MKKRPISPVYILFLVFLAGFSVLIYEVSWFRMLSLVLGATVSASTIVLVAFMAGFGLGAWYWGKNTGSRFKPLTLLPGLLISAGILGFGSYFLLDTGSPALYTMAAKAGLSVTFSEILIFISSLILLFIPAFFMGGILPVASGLLIQSDTNLSGLMGNLYAWETIGSTLGGLAAGFILIRTFGQQYTIFIAAAINIISALPLLYYFLQPEVEPITALLFTYVDSAAPLPPGSRPTTQVPSTVSRYSIISLSKRVKEGGNILAFGLKMKIRISIEAPTPEINFNTLAR